VWESSRVRYTTCTGNIYIFCYNILYLSVIDAQQSGDVFVALIFVLYYFVGIVFRFIREFHQLFLFLLFSTYSHIFQQTWVSHTRGSDSGQFPVYHIYSINLLFSTCPYKTQLLNKERTNLHNLYLKLLK
jgi:hypothetical protein